MTHPDQDNLDALLSRSFKRKSLRFDARAWTLKNQSTIDRFLDPQETGQINPWRMIMFKNRIHIATAATVLLLLAITFTCMTGSPDGANTAWGDVTRLFGQIEHFHYYSMVSRDNTLTTSEGWYAHQKLHWRSDQPQVKWFEDGQTLKAYDEHQNLVVLAPSELRTCSTPLSVLALGLETVTTDTLKGLTPETVGDFLIYSFPPPRQHQDWLDRISVTVGKDSLLPTQIKIYNKPRPRMEKYTLIVFDYDEPEKPLDFFDPPTQSLPPHGQAKIKLGGPPVEIKVKGAPGIDKAIVR